MRSVLVQPAIVVVLGLVAMACNPAASLSPPPTRADASATPRGTHAASASPTEPPTATAQTTTPTPREARPVGWTTTGNMADVSRDRHTATLLRDGMILVVGGTESARAELFNPNRDHWVTTGNLHEVRTSQTATLLRDGRVLIAGGVNASGETLATAELYDPATGTWSMTGPMKTPRAGHTATQLPDGTILVVGGATDFDGTVQIATAEVFDPRSGVWSTGGRLAQARSSHTATLLRDGHVLVAGGAGPFVGPSASPALASAEVYDPESRSWSKVVRMAGKRFKHTASLLADGRVLITGGTAGFGIPARSAELFDPVGATWAAAREMREPRYEHTATVLEDGRVVIAGGSSRDGFLAAAELYEPAAGRWTATVPMGQPRSDHEATLMLDGDVLVTDGNLDDDRTSAERYHPGG